MLISRPSSRWAVPAAAAVLLVGGGSVIGSLSATASGGLEPRTAAQLLSDVQQVDLPGLSGTVVERADLGLPSLGALGGAGGDSSSLTSMVSGSHTLRVWYAGQDRARLALQGSLGESDVIRSGSDVWTWESKTKKATHYTVPAGHDGADGGEVGPVPMTPQQAAEKALAAIDPTTKVSVDGSSSVAGRQVHDLVLEPRDSRTLVGSVHIAVDGETHVPLQVKIYPAGSSTPAFQVGFTSFDPTTPSSSVFAFNPPPGTKVTESGAGSGAKPEMKGDTRPETKGDAPRPANSTTTVGTGWTSVVVTRVPAAALKPSKSGDSQTAQLAQLVRSLPSVTGSFGTGHVLRGTLFSAILTDDNRLAVGAVDPSLLEAALAR